MYGLPDKLLLYHRLASICIALKKGLQVVTYDVLWLTFLVV
ncbi:MAG: hypothetical protein FD155_712 [Bacteroidetes bacterium]|nr:MAG: hypothetical protein FD155_712 [Bacteroidota bacterium]